MFPSVSSSHVHPGSAHLPPASHQPEAPRPSAPVSIHLSIENSHAHAGEATLHLALPASYVALPSGKLQPDFVHPGLQIDEKGRRFISDGEHMYAIRFDRDHRTERVYQPDNPAKPGIPVRLNEAGRYVLHGEVGLRGGSPGRDLARRLDAAQQNLNRALTAKRDAQGEMTAINAEIRYAGNPDAGLRQRRQDVQRRLDDAKMTIAIEDGRIEGVAREVQMLRQSFEAQVTDKRRHREDGRQLEQTTQREIDTLQTTMNRSDHPTANMRDDLRKLHDDLRRIQNANHELDRQIENLHRDLADIPHF
ncbi:hypothetical protein LFL96_30335 [Paraburkholderia sp. D15]|uniref:hypothetical protein n=1 Tax=Paraburkholderia sp. D15 TaxID=2880218 RepID=UPI00247AFEC6|nr:hypothetical protein [Paraburkholderia sp. D15]WGS52488.1 hypothetical protein LFL96_30335 [Paraburkholderia sp. D15]